MSQKSYTFSFRSSRRPKRNSLTLILCAAGGDHRLGRNAVQQVGRSTDEVALDHGDLGAQPSGVGGRGVAGRTATDDQKAHGHGTKDTGRRPAGRVTSCRDPALRP